MAEKIWMSLAHVSQAEQDALVEAVNSGWVTSTGPFVDRFERGLAEFCGRRHAVAVTSGTAALHLGMLGLGVERGDVVVTSSMTFAATANAVTYTGAEPVFVDADESGNVNPDLLRAAVDGERAKGRRVAAVLPVDLLGKTVAHEQIDAIAAERDIPVLSDAAESLGAIYRGRPAAAYGHAAALSFNGNKIMTTSGGGALLTDDESLATHARYLSTQARQPVIWYEHTDIGYNYRLSNLLAALGCAQLSRLPEMLERRRWIRLAYREFFAAVPGVSIFGGADGSEHPTSAPAGDVLSTRPSGEDDVLRAGEASRGALDHDNFWLTSIVIDPQVAGFTATDLREHLAADEIESRPLWKPMHLQPVFAGCTAYVDGTAERLFRNGLSLPSGSGMSDEQFDRVLASIQTFIESR